MSRSTTYRVLAVVSGCALLVIPALIPGKLDIPRPSRGSRDTTVSRHNSFSENLNETVSQLFMG